MSLFRYGVASGDPGQHAVTLWTHADTGDEVRWVLARDEALEEVVQSGTTRAREEDGRTLKIHVEDLDPATTYWYAFEAAGERSRLGRTRTLPDDDRPVTFAVTSCAKYTAGYFNAYRDIVNTADEIDLWLHLGDYIYEYPSEDGKAPGPRIGRPMDPENECRSLEDYRRRYAHYRLDPDLQDLHALVPLVAIPDDHEFCNDTWREGAKNHDEEEDGPWEPRKAAALRAWTEWIPARLPGDHRVYRDFRVGELADLIVLDSRTLRDEMTKDREELEREDRTMLSGEQLEWLFERLEDADGLWRIVATPVMIGQVYTEFLPEELGDPLSEIGILTDEEHGPNPDQWDGYPAERLRVFEFLRERGMDNVVFLAGDVHSSWAVELHPHPEDRDETPLAVEFVTTSVTSENLDDEMGTERRTVSVDVEEKVKDDNPHIRFVELDYHGWMRVEVSPERVRTTWRYVEQLHERSDAAFHGATWEVDRGERRLRAVDVSIPTGAPDR